MVPSLTPAGRSFRGAGAYYFHDKGAETSERVGWTHTENLATDDPHRAMKIMAWTARNADALKRQSGGSSSGRKLEKPVFAFSVAWHPDERPDEAHMLATAQGAVGWLGLGEHQAVYVRHTDQQHPHVHVVVNRVHPETGKAATLSHSRRKAQEWALTYEREHGLRCERRAENAAAREAAKTKRAAGKEKIATAERTGDPAMLRAWEISDSGASFRAALAAGGYDLAAGRKRIVAVDPYGKTHNPVRRLDGVTAAQFRTRMSDLNPDDLPSVAEVLARRKSQKTAERTRPSVSFQETAAPPPPSLRPEFRTVSRDPFEYRQSADYLDKLKQLRDDQNRQLRKTLKERRVAADRAKAELQQTAAADAADARKQHAASEEAIAKQAERDARHERREDAARLAREFGSTQTAEKIDGLNAKLQSAGLIDRLARRPAKWREQVRAAEEQKKQADKQVRDVLDETEQRRDQTLREQKNRREAQHEELLNRRQAKAEGQLEERLKREDREALIRLEQRQGLTRGRFEREQFRRANKNEHGQSRGPTEVEQTRLQVAFEEEREERRASMKRSDGPAIDPDSLETAANHGRHAEQNSLAGQVLRAEDGRVGGKEGDPPTLRFDPPEKADGGLAAGFQNAAADREGYGGQGFTPGGGGPGGGPSNDGPTHSL